MRIVRWLPILLAFSAFGCGAERQLAGPKIPGASTPSSALGAMGTEAPATGAVYSMTNSPAGNEVLAFARGADGRLSSPVAYATGGTGTGAGLGNQGALALGTGGRWLYVVNAGSHDVSAFRASGRNLALVDRVASGGERPVSLTVRGDRLYVLNAGGSGNIQGFRIGADGSLAAIAGSSRPLSTSSAMAAQIGFTPDGGHLVVSERATNVLSVYAVADDGSVTGPMVHPSSGSTPFGFGFDRQGTLVVSEAFGGAPNGSAVSSYQVARDGSLHLVSGSVQTTQTAACWIAVTDNGRFAYTTNAGSATVTGYVVGSDGTLARLDASGVTATTGMGPSEMAASPGSRTLYVLNGGAHTVGAYAVGADGHLASLGSFEGLPAGANGLVAR